MNRECSDMKQSDAKQTQSHEVRVKHEEIEEKNVKEDSTTRITFDLIPRQKLKIDTPITFLQFSPLSDTLLIALSDGTLTIYDCSAQKFNHITIKGKVSLMRWAPNEKLFGIVYEGGSQVSIYKQASELQFSHLADISHQMSQLNDFLFFEDSTGVYIVTGSLDGLVICCNIDLPESYRIVAHLQSPVISLANGLLNTTQVIISSTLDGYLRAHLLESADCISIKTESEFCVTGIGFNPKEYRLFTCGSKSNSLVEWDMNMGEIKRYYDGYENEAHESISLKLYEDDIFLVTMGSLIKAWNVNSETPLMTKNFTSEISAVSVGKKFVAISTQSTADATDPQCQILSIRKKKLKRKRKDLQPIPETTKHESLAETKQALVNQEEELPQAKKIVVKTEEISVHNEPAEAQTTTATATIPSVKKEINGDENDKHNSKNEQTSEEENERTDEEGDTEEEEESDENESEKNNLDINLKVNQILTPDEIYFGSSISQTVLSNSGNSFFLLLSNGLIKAFKIEDMNLHRSSSDPTIDYLQDPGVKDTHFSPHFSISKGDKYLISTLGRDINLYSIEKFSHLHVIHKSDLSTSITFLLFSPFEEDVLAIGLSNGTVIVKSIEQEVICTIDTQTREPIIFIQFMQVQSRVLLVIADRSNQVQIFHLHDEMLNEQNECLFNIYQCNTDPVVFMDSHGPLLLICNSTSLELFDFDPVIVSNSVEKCTTITRKFDKLVAAVFSCSGEFISVLLSNGQLELWNTKLSVRRSDNFALDSPIWLSRHPNEENTFLVSSDSGVVSLLSPDSDEFS